MAWLEEQIKTKGRQIGEWEAGEKLTEFRSHEQYFAYVAMRGIRSMRADENMGSGLAYDNISASGPNGGVCPVESEFPRNVLTFSGSALPHYSPEKGKDRTIDTTSPYIIDAGAQYFGQKWLLV
jgi:Xaa-Pro aminopeptidase